jgi:hypothetical protein
MNRHLGEEEVRLGGRTYVLRPTFQALAEIEAELGEPLLVIADRVLSGRVGTREVVATLRAGIKAGDAEVPADLEAEILAAGVLATTARVVAWLRRALMGDPEARPAEPNPPEAGSA